MLLRLHILNIASNRFVRLHIMISYVSVSFTTSTILRRKRLKETNVVFLHPKKKSHTHTHFSAFQYFSVFPTQAKESVTEEMTSNPTSSRNLNTLKNNKPSLLSLLSILEAQTA